MKRISKKALAFALSTLIALGGMGMMSGCGSDGGDISVLLLVNNQEDAFYKEYFAELEEEMNIKIDYRGESFSDYDTALTTSMQDTPPDIFYVRPGNLKMYVADGLLADMSDYLESDEFTSQVDVSRLYPHVIDIYRYDGKTVSVSDPDAPIYGINQGLSYQGLGYNKTLIERKESQIRAAGLCMPWELGEGENAETYTFEEFSLLLSLVKDTTGGGLNGNLPIAGMNIPTEIMPLVWSYGGEIVSGDSVTVTTEPFQKVLTWLRENYEAGNLSRSATWGEWSTNEVAFYTEIGSWEVSGYIESGMDFDVMPWPTADGGDGWYGQIGTAAYGVFADSPNLDLAMEIVAGFLREDVQDKMVRKGLALPIYKETAEGGYLTDDETYKPEHRSVFIEVISGRHGKYSPVNNTFDSEWYDAFTDDILTFVTESSQTAAEWLGAKQTEMQTLFDRQLNRSKA